MQKKLIIHFKTASDNTKLLHTLRCFARFARLIHILERHLAFVRRFGLGVARNIGASMTQLDSSRPAVDFRIVLRMPGEDRALLFKGNNIKMLW